MARQLLIVICLFLSIHGYSQQNYLFGTKHKNGITSIYYSIPGKSAYDFSVQYRYGLLNENTNKEVLPIKYKTIYSSNIDDLFIVEDTLKKWSIYSLKTNSFIVKSEHNDIKTFSDGLAIASKYINNQLLFGAYDATGKLQIPFEYKYLGYASEGLIAFSKEKGYGFIDKKNNVVIPALYRSASGFKNGLACVSLLDSVYYGYIDKNNKWIIKPKYLRGGDFNGQYAVVFKTRNYTLSSDNGGVIDKSGKEIIPLEYDYITIEDNFFIVKKLSKISYLTETKYGIFDFTGKALIPIECKEIKKKFGTDFYEIQKNDKFSLIDKYAKTVLEPYDYLYTFTDYGLSHIKRDGKYSVINNTLKTIIPERGATSVLLGRKNRVALLFKNKVEVFDITGKLLKTIEQNNVATYGTEFTKNDDSLKVKFTNSTYLYDIASDKMQPLDYTEIGDFNDDGVFVGKNITFDFVNADGRKLNTKSYYSVVNFSEGIAAVQESAYSTPYLIDRNFTKIKDLTNIFEGPFSEGLAKAKPQYGTSKFYYDKKGNLITVADVSEISDFKNGRAYVKQYTGGKYYFINKSGTRINTELYDEVGGFSDNVALVKRDGKVGYIDTTGKLIISFKFDAGSAFYNGVAMVKNVNEFYLINKKGEKQNKEIFNGALNPANGTFPVQKGTMYGLIDETGKVLIDFKYQEITPLSEDVAWAKKDGKWGLVGSGNKQLTDFIYSSGDNCKNGYVKAGDGKKVSLLNKNGKQILPLIYDQMGKIYNNKVLLLLNAGTNVVSLK
jgi:hypothetical protein